MAVVIDGTNGVTVPAGATGDEVPQAQEVVPLTGNVTMTGPLSVPAGASGVQVPQAQEIFGKSQSWETVTRNNGVSYTNSTNKPIIVSASGVSSATSGDINITVAGHRVSVASYAAAVGGLIAANAVVPPGSTYAVAWSSMVSVTVREYR